MSTISNHFTERWISVFELPNQNSSFNINFQGPTSSATTNQNQNNNNLHLWGVLSVGEVPMSLENRYKYLSSSNNNHNGNENENKGNSTKMMTALEFYSEFTDAQDLAEIPIEFVILSFSSDINDINQDDFEFSKDSSLNLLLQGDKKRKNNNNNSLLNKTTKNKRKQDNKPNSRLRQKTKRTGLVVTSSDDDDDDEDDIADEITNSSQATQFEDDTQQQNEGKNHSSSNNNTVEHFCIWKQSRKLSEALPSYYKVQGNDDDDNSPRQPKQQHRYGSYLATLREYFLDSTTTTSTSTTNNYPSGRLSEDDASNINNAMNQRKNTIFNPPPCFVYSSTIPPSERVLLPALPEMLHQNLWEFIKGGDECFYEPAGNTKNNNASGNNLETKNTTTMSHQQNQSSINKTIENDAKTELLQNYLRQYQQNNNNDNSISESFIPGTSFPQQHQQQQVQLALQNKTNNRQQQNSGFTSTLQHQHDIYSKQQQSILVQTLCQNQQEQPLSIGTNNSSSSASSLPKPSMLINNNNNVSSTAASLLILANQHATNNNLTIPATSSSSSLPIPPSALNNSMTHRQQCRFSLHGLNALTPSTTVFQCYFYNLENSEFIPMSSNKTSKNITNNNAASQLTFLRFDRMAKVESQSASQASILESLMRSLGLLFAGCVHMRSGELRIVDTARRALNDGRVLHAKMKRDEAKRLESFCEILNRKKAKIADLERIVIQERTEKVELKKEVERLKALMLPNNNNNYNTAELTQQRLNDNYDTDEEGGSDDADDENNQETKGHAIFADNDLFLTDNSKPIQGKRDRNQKDHERNHKSDGKKRHLPEEDQEDLKNKNNRKMQQQQSSSPSNRNKDNNKKESSGRFLMNNI